MILYETQLSPSLETKKAIVQRALQELFVVGMVWLFVVFIFVPEVFLFSLGCILGIYGLYFIGVKKLASRSILCGYFAILRFF